MERGAIGGGRVIHHDRDCSRRTKAPTKTRAPSPRTRTRENVTFVLRKSWHYSALPIHRSVQGLSLSTRCAVRFARRLVEMSSCLPPAQRSLSGGPLVASPAEGACRANSTAGRAARALVSPCAPLPSCLLINPNPLGMPSWSRVLYGPIGACLARSETMK